MELRHLKYALVVADELHFGRAAQRLNISQPPLSKQIRQLEEEIGIKIFLRTKRRVQLTEPGRLFLDEARLVLAQAEQAAKVARRASQGEIGQLTIGTVTSTYSGFYRLIIEVLRTFSKKYPDVRIALRTLTVSQQIQALRDDRIQVGFVTVDFNDEQALAVEPVRREPLMLAIPQDHRLAAQQRVPLRALADEPHILVPRHLAPRYNGQLVAGHHNRGFTMKIVHETDNHYTSLALVAAGLGVSLLPASLQDLEIGGVVFRELQPPLPQLELSVAYKREGQAEVVRKFLGIVRQVAAYKFSDGRHVERKKGAKRVV